MAGIGTWSWPDVVDANHSFANLVLVPSVSFVATVDAALQASYVSQHCPKNRNRDSYTHLWGLVVSL